MNYIASTNYGKFKYPDHFKYPDGFENYFLQHEFIWKEIFQKTGLDNDSEKNAIEIGALHGGCSVWLLENFVKNGTLDCIDINESEHLKNNLSPYHNVIFHKGLSSDVLLDLNRQYKEPYADLVYIDGSHIAKHVMEDAILSWRLLKFGGVMIFDDYGWGPTEATENQPKTGIDAFLLGYQKNYEIIGQGWQVYIKKIRNEISEGVLSSNYAENNPHFNKDKY